MLPVASMSPQQKAAQLQRVAQVTGQARVAVSPGTLPFINLSSGILDQIFRQARSAGGVDVTVPLLAGLLWVGWQGLTWGVRRVKNHDPGEAGDRQSTGS